MWSEFKKFAFKGNVMDMAVGVMIGAAFNGIVSSIVNDVFMPLFGLIFDTTDLGTKFIVLKGVEGVDGDDEHDQRNNRGKAGCCRGRRNRAQLRQIPCVNNQLFHYRTCNLLYGQAH